MGDYDKKRAGESLKIPARTWNKLVDLIAKDRTGTLAPALDGSPAALAGGALLNASSATALDSWKLAQLTGPQIDTEQALMFAHTETIANGSPSSLLRGEAFYRYLHIGYKAAANEEIALPTAGIVPAKITVTDAEHPCVEVAYSGGEIIYTSTWDGPHWIVWKESGTGSDLKAVLRLGQITGRLLYAQATSNWKKTSGRPSSRTDHEIVSWGYVDAKIRTGPIGLSAETIKVLLPTGPGKDPNVISGQILPIVRSHRDVPNRTNSGISYTNNQYGSDYKWIAVGANHIDDAIGTARLILRGTGSYTPPQGWALVDGSQDTAKTLSTVAADAAGRFPRFQKNATETGGADTLEITVAEIIDRIADHPAADFAHIHGLNSVQNLVADGGDFRSLDTGIYQTLGQSGIGDIEHTAEAGFDPIEKDIIPQWLGFTVIERIDNSA
jgi:hypothetical protein